MDSPVKIKYRYKRFLVIEVEREVEGENLHDCHTKANLQIQNSIKMEEAVRDDDGKISYKLQSWEEVKS